MLEDQNADDRDVHTPQRSQLVDSDQRGDDHTDKADQANHRKYRRLEISAGPHVTVMYSAPMKASFGV